MTVAEKILIAEISQYQSLNVINQSGLFGGGEDLNLPRKLYLIRKGVQRTHTNNPTSSTLTSTSNYLLALCGEYQFSALAAQSSGGTVSPISSTGTIIDDLDFIVSANSYIATGQTSVTFDGTNGKPDLRGYNIDFFRSGQPMYTTTPPDGRLYYSWNKVTGQFQLLSTDPLVNASAQALEQFRISPDSTGGTSSSTTSTSWRRLVITSGAFQPDGVTCNLATIVGSTYTLTVIGFNQEPQFAGVFFNYTSGGFQIIWPGFLASNFGNIIIDKID